MLLPRVYLWPPLVLIGPAGSRNICGSSQHPMPAHPAPKLLLLPTNRSCIQKPPARLYHCHAFKRRQVPLPRRSRRQGCASSHPLPTRLGPAARLNRIATSPAAWHAPDGTKASTRHGLRKLRHLRTSYGQVTDTAHLHKTWLPEKRPPSRFHRFYPVGLCCKLAS